MMHEGIRPITQQVLTVMWSIVGLGIVAVIIYALDSREPCLAGPHDLGSVSAQWIAEHRTDQLGDGPR